MIAKIVALAKKAFPPLAFTANNTEDLEAVLSISLNCLETFTLSFDYFDCQFWLPAKRKMFELNRSSTDFATEEFKSLIVC